MNYNDETLLEMVELYAEEMGYIASEEELSELFDEQVAPDIIEIYGKKGEEFSDTIMMNEAFNDWAGILYKDGDIHPKQYDSYGYIGEYS